MNIKVFITENLDELLPRRGGSFGVNYFERPDCPDTKEELEPWIVHLRKLSDHIGTRLCDFYIEGQGMGVAAGTIEGEEKVYWRD